MTGEVEGLLVYARLLGLAAREAGPFGLLVDPARPESSRLWRGWLETGRVGIMCSIPCHP